MPPSRALVLCVSLAATAGGCAVYDATLLQATTEQGGSASVGGAGGGVAGGAGRAPDGGGGTQKDASADVVRDSAVSDGRGGTVIADVGPEAEAVPDWMIDDMESKDSFIDYRGGRYGLYYVAGDLSATGKLDWGKVYNPDGHSTYAMRFSGAGFGQNGGWGASMGFDLNYTTQKEPYDASKYAGISFWVRLAPECTYPDAAQPCQTGLFVALPDMDTDPTGGICYQDGSAAGCYNDFGTTIPNLSQTWQQVILRFADAKQNASWGMKFLALDTAHLLSIKFQTPEGAKPFDYLFDDIAFLP
jgi:hypothetical protein